jgi:hypothetical protein
MPRATTENLGGSPLTGLITAPAIAKSTATTPSTRMNRYRWHTVS